MVAWQVLPFIPLAKSGSLEPESGVITIVFLMPRWYNIDPQYDLRFNASSSNAEYIRGREFHSRHFCRASFVLQELMQRHNPPHVLISVTGGGSGVTS